MRYSLFSKKNIFKITALGLCMTVLALSVGSVFAVSSATDNVVVTLAVDEGITISDGADAALAPNIGLLSDGAIGSSAWTVTTNAALGYSLAVKATTTPALQSGSNSFADYTEAAAGTPETWSIASGAKEFGYSAYGTDTATATWGTAASCGTSGTPDAAQKYVGFSTTDKTIATKAAPTATSGVTTTICFAAAQNSVFAPAGTYTATITATATTL